MKGHCRHKLKVIHQARGLTAEAKQPGVKEGCWWGAGWKEQRWAKTRPPPNRFVKTSMHVARRQAASLAPRPPRTRPYRKQTLSCSSVVSSRALCPLNKLDLSLRTVAAQQHERPRGEGWGQALLTPVPVPPPPSTSIPAARGERLARHGARGASSPSQPPLRSSGSGSTGSGVHPISALGDILSPNRRLQGSRAAQVSANARPPPLKRAPQGRVICPHR